MDPTQAGGGGALQDFGVPLQTPEAHVSLTVQGFPSSQIAPLVAV